METKNTGSTPISAYYFSLGLIVIFTTYSTTLFAAQWLITRL